MVSLMVISRSGFFIWRLNVCGNMIANGEETFQLVGLSMALVFLVIEVFWIGGEVTAARVLL